MLDLLYPHPSTLLLLLPFFFFFFAMPADADSYNSSYPSCPSYRCGDAIISYPFWKVDSEPTTQFCGYQGFGINCTSSYDYEQFIPEIMYIPEITFGGGSYYVRRINYDSKNITVHDRSLKSDIWARLDINKETWPFQNLSYCPRVRHGINLQTLPLKISTLDITFSFNCLECPSFETTILCFERNEEKPCVRFFNIGNGTEVMYLCTDEEVKTIIDNNISRFLNFSTGEVVFERELELQWTRMEGCGKCEESGGRCGSHNTRGLICFCTDGTISNYDCQGADSFNATIIVVIGIVSTLLSFLVIFIMRCILKPPSSNCVASLKHITEEDKNIEAFVMQYGSLSTKRYEYSDIKKMTNSFKVKLGQGGFGEVFKGMISDGRLVAVKILSTSKSNGQEFINEVASMGRTSHVNIVTLLGFCFDHKKRALVYEYMPNGSLEKFIHSHVPTETGEKIGVKKLYEIALGIAHGLDYLHRGCNTRILHLDIKPHNILLDEDFCPKIADFGLAKLYSRKESVVSMLEARGTLGYIAPEAYNRNFGRVSHKSDVYSYGMLLLEMVGGRKNIDVGVEQTGEIYFPDLIYKRLHKHDFLLDSIMTTEENNYARKMAIVGLWCIQADPNQRPAINEVIEMLDGTKLEALEFPPKPIVSSTP